MNIPETSATIGNNIYLNGRPELVLQNGQGALLMKIDGVNGTTYGCYQLVSIAD